MNTKMSIHRALGEIKLYDKKIVDLLDKDFVLASKKRIAKVHGIDIEKYKGEMKSNLQSLRALMRNRQVLKSAIAKSNEETFVTIGGVEMTVLDAIERKNFMNMRMSVVNTLKAQFNRADREVRMYEDNLQTNLENYIKNTTKELNNKDLIDSLTESYKNLNEVVLLDPSNLRAVIEEMTKENDQFNTEVDYVLSESNSNTFIEVDLEG